MRARPMRKRAASARAARTMVDAPVGGAQQARHVGQRQVGGGEHDAQARPGEHHRELVDAGAVGEVLGVPGEREAGARDPVLGDGRGAERRDLAAPGRRPSRPRARRAAPARRRGWAARARSRSRARAPARGGRARRAAAAAPAAPAAAPGRSGSPKTRARASGRASSARTTISGPMPAGSPSEMPMVGLPSARALMRPHHTGFSGPRPRRAGRSLGVPRKAPGAASNARALPRVESW